MTMRMAGSEMDELPVVSVIMPCRNEERFIGMSLDSILASDYPMDKLEILVVDGMSDDRTRSIVQQYANKHPLIHLYDNPRRIAPVAQNIGIGHAKGDVIVILDAHDTYAPDYISKCVEHMYEYDVDHVGGIWKILPRDNTFIAKTIVRAMSHPFGVGNAHYRTKKISEPMFTDAAAFGCYRKEVFQQFGLFDENLARSYDFELNSRLKKAGRGILLVPDAVVYYYARSTLVGFIKHSFTNGFWVTYPLRFGKRAFSARHLVPLGFVAGLLGSAALAPVWSAGWWMLGGIGGAHALANVVASAQVATQERDVRYLLLLPVVFAGAHLAYGLGSLWGLAKVLATTMSRPFTKNEAKSA
ncbi:MAG: glycosyltransferase family 2 protein [Chloroflexota bacterium]